MTEGFAAVPNWMFRDRTKPSLFAVMVYGALASHQGRGGVYPSRVKIAEEAQCSVRKVADALNELEGLGVVVRTRRTNKSGQATSGYDLRPGGLLGADEEEAHDALTGEVGAHGAVGEGTSVHLVPLIEEEPLKKKSPGEEFEVFWAVYPRKVDKPKARRAFEAALKRASAEVIIEGARRYRDDPSRDPQFTKYPQGWLSGDRWADESSAVVPASEPLVGLPGWLESLRIPVEEFLERRSEPGWVESMARMAYERPSSIRRREGIADV